ncbi:MAG: TetR/AcrR family transcriptional regulator [Beijerinckiaceae bacterium]|nr:TetR/AcrR family transcriptional regulator [Beijerinckiaceae bacterium]
MGVFWERGFSATSMENLVLGTGVSRGGIYADFGGKEQLYLACLSTYKDRFAGPAIAKLNAPGDGLAAIEAYFDHFISLHAKRGMPGPGCFIANTMTEHAPHNTLTLDIVTKHSQELKAGFLNALRAACNESGVLIADTELSQLAGFLVTASQGLWSYARSITDLSELVRFKIELLNLLRARLSTLK